MSAARPRFATPFRLFSIVSTVALTATIAVSGCSKPETAQTSAPAATPTASPADATASEQVVAQFLDRVRRGGDLSEASALLTDLARSELTRIGQPIQPIGSPDARFAITRSEAVATGDGELPHRLVHCLWTEPSLGDDGKPNGQTEEFQVVWSVARQTAGWRISGMVIEMSPNEAPMVLDFENGESMAMMLGVAPTEQTAAAPAASNR